MKTLTFELYCRLRAALPGRGEPGARSKLRRSRAMSPRTLFYLIWHGVPGAEARKANALLALWDDADFARCGRRWRGDAEFFGGQTRRSETHAGAGCRNSPGCWKIRSRLGM